MISRVGHSITIHYNDSVQAKQNINRNRVSWEIHIAKLIIKAFLLFHELNNNWIDVEIIVHFVIVKLLLDKLCQFWIIILLWGNVCDPYKYVTIFTSIINSIKISLKKVINVAEKKIKVIIREFIVQLFYLFIFIF